MERKYDIQKILITEYELTQEGYDKFVDGSIWDEEDKTDKVNIYNFLGLQVGTECEIIKIPMAKNDYQIVFLLIDDDTNKPNTNYMSCSMDLDEIFKYIKEKAPKTVEKKTEVKKPIRKEEKKMSGKTGISQKMKEMLLPSQVEAGDVAITFDGKVAVRRDNGDYVSYNPTSRKIENQMEFVINNNALAKMFFYMPTKELAVGDIIKESDIFYVVTDDQRLTVINLSAGDTSSLVMETNLICGDKMYLKVVSLFNGQGGQNMLANPMMMAMMNEDSDNNMLQMMMMSQMMNGAGANTTNQSIFGNMNPMMLMMLMQKDNDSDLTPLLMMSMMGMMNNKETEK